MELDAIVNAANKDLQGGTGVDGSIHRGAGHLLRQENQRHGSCEVGKAVISCGYLLPATFVISTVGPQVDSPKNPTEEQKQLLFSAYSSSLEEMRAQNLRSIVRA